MNRLTSILFVMVVTTGLTLATPSSDDRTEWYGSKRPKHPALFAPYPQTTPGLTGSGIFELHVRPDGIVAHVAIVKSTGHEQLDSAAITSFRNWRFVPGTIKRTRTRIDFVTPGQMSAFWGR